MKKNILIISVSIIITIVLLFKIKAVQSQTVANIIPPTITVILDAGHGGEDGGAVADDGTLEKDLNLLVSKKTELFFTLFGIKYIPTRTTDTAISDPGLNTVRQRKVSDIHNRYALINNTENSILLSIHMNKFPAEKYSGAQVFHSPNDTVSVLLASMIQNNIKTYIQPDNNRQVKASSGSIYLLDKATRPSVLVECGFLSNENELKELKNEKYQAEIAYILSKTMLDFMSDVRRDKLNGEK